SVAVRTGEHAPVLCRLSTPRSVGRDVPGAQIHFLAGESPPEKGGWRAIEEKPWTRRRSQHGGTQNCTHLAGGAAAIMEDDVEGIVDFGAIAFDAHVRGDGFGNAEEHQGMID